MSVNARSTVVGVFRDRAMAGQALDALKNAGFHRDQIRYSGGTMGGFLGDIKNLFSTQETTNDNFTTDLANMGLSDEETQYYTNEYHNGNTIVAVNTPGREQEALNLLHQHGAYNSNVRPDAAATIATTAPIQHPLDPRSAQNYSAADTNRPVTPPNAQPYTTRDNQPVASTTASHDPQRHAAQPQNYGTDVASHEAQLQARHTELQTQLQTAQQQLRDAQVQLQALKQREAQMQAYKQHETQLHTTEKQLQDTQAQLQATMAELRAAQARVSDQPNQ